VPFGVPWPTWEQRAPAQRWAPTAVEVHDVHGRAITVVTDGLRGGFQHVCSPRAVCEVLAQLPRSDVNGLGLVVLRQAARKEEIFRLAWGRIRWCVDFRGYSGPAVMVDAIDFTHPRFWLGRSLPPEWQREVERLRDFGFAVQLTRRGYVLEVAEPEPVRRWLLARTVPHEVGHWVDFRHWVLDRIGIPDVGEARNHPSYESLLDNWDRRPEREPEEFADRYADEAQHVVLDHLNTLSGPR
jgi:hypothetical protein